MDVRFKKKWHVLVSMGCHVWHVDVAKVMSDDVIMDMYWPAGSSLND